MPSGHTDREYENELARIREQVVHMGGKVEAMLADGFRAFETRDAGLARQVVAADDDVDRLQVEIDELCLQVLARRQPMASDLRFVTTAMKLVTDLERMADLCAHIAARTTELVREPAAGALQEISAMAATVGRMVRHALDAFASADVATAHSVIETDRVVDAHHAQAFRQLLNRIVEDRANVSWATCVQSVSRALERIGDHATNLAEMVVFMVQGRDIRHAAGRQSRKAERARGILFLCVHNAARSPMAEGWARKLLPADTGVFSAGSDPAAEVDPLAVQVMREAGVDISGHRPRRISDVSLDQVDTVITLCAEELCVTLPGIIRRETWVLPDPASATGDSGARLDAYRSIRDALRARIEGLLGG